MEILETGEVGRPWATSIDGETAFKLHDTYGFPVDLTADVCRERGVDGRRRAGFEAAMNRQRERPRLGKFKMAAGTRRERSAPPSTATSTWPASTAAWSR